VRVRSRAITDFVAEGQAEVGLPLVDLRQSVFSIGNGESLEKSHVGLEVEGDDIRVASRKGDREFLRDNKSAHACAEDGGL
jgi:hypothetical protein